MADAIKKISGWENTYVVCGADEPKSIEMLRKYKIRAEATDNRKGSVSYRIKATSTKKVFVTKDSPNVWAGYEVYRWAEDRDGNPKNEPDHEGSDAMDAVSYAAASINPMQKYVNSNSQMPVSRVNVGL